jgi:hypothetical protein
MLAATSATEPPMLPEGGRDLTAYLDSIWQHYFADTPRVNAVLIGYCYPWKSRLGLIRLSEDKQTTFIGINSLLQLPQVPECVLTTTIAHELTHYAHGFGSPLPRICKHPHANGIVDRELERRELGEQLRCCNEWIDQYWYSFYDRQRSLICSLKSSLAKAKSAQKYP